MNLSLLSDGKTQAAILVILLVLYIITKNPVFGILTLLAMLFLLGVEVYVGVKAHGWKSELRDTLIAVVVAALLYYGLGFALHTSSPISAVVSCSMLPSLSRGDLIVIQGSLPSSPTWEVSEEDMKDIQNPNITVLVNGKVYKMKGSIFSYCLFNSGEVCDKFRENPSSVVEKRGNFIFKYGMCKRIGKLTYYQPCLKEIVYKNNTLSLSSKQGDVVVYTPKKEDLFGFALRGGEVVHRVVLTLKRGNKTLYITKGDNNNVADMQFYSYTYDKGNSPVLPSQIKGKVVFRIPFLGYYKLFLVGSFSETEFCSSVLSYT